MKILTVKTAKVDFSHLWKKQETASGGAYFTLDSRFRGNDNGLLYLAKELRIMKYDPSTPSNALRTGVLRTRL